MKTSASIDSTLAMGRQMMDQQKAAAAAANPMATSAGDNPLQVIMMIFQMLQTLMGGGGAAPAGTAGAPAAAAPAGAAAAPAAAPANNGRIKIAQIDNFTGTTHGNEISDTLKKGGGDPSLAGKIDVQQFNVSGGNLSANVAGALSQVLNQVKSGQQVDAVNISLQDFQNSASNQQVQALIEQLSAAGVPVAVAAGNNGPNQRNQLTSTSSFNVQSSGSDSGRGNVQGNGPTTSFATANLTPTLAAKHAAGQSLSQIKASV